MEIAYVANKFFPGTAANTIQIISMAEALQANNVGVTLIAFRGSDKGNAEAIFKSYDVRYPFKVILLNPAKSYYLREIQLMMYVFQQRKKYQNIYSRSLLFSLFVKSFFPSKKVVYELHDFVKNSLFKTLFQSGAKRFDMIVVISKRLKKDLAQAGITKVCYLPDGVDRAKFDNITTQKAELRQGLGLPSNKILVLYSGNFHPAKGLYTFLDSFSFLREDLKKTVQFLILGGTKDEISRLQKAYPYAWFTGYKEHREIPKFLKAVDIFIIANSAREDLGETYRVAKYYTSPLKLFEYMAAKNPMIATKVPALQEILDQHAALLVEPDSPQAIAKAIQRLIKNPRLAKNTSENAYKKVKKFSWYLRAKRIKAMF
ncbi:glycosyltransferase family 4 protein [Candidatus Woesearchaeota archaeon]|nr:glycosyltransferase family 4 protein [Candidatus Woesearchaeota archaeon]